MEIKNKNFTCITLGCRVNLFESNMQISALKQAGAKYVNEIDDAHIILINTCSVTHKADAKSRYMINKACNNPSTKLVICMGCYTQLSFNELSHAKIGIIIGNKYKNSIVELIKKYDGHKIVKISNLQTENKFEENKTIFCTEKTRAFIKIQDGCNFFCSYCLIPYVRGKQRSLPMAKIIKNIIALHKQGYKEIVLTGVNTSGYKDGNNSFYDLLNKINLLKGNFRIRISSVEPFQINKKIIDLLINNKNRFCQFLHLCLQSGCDKTLVDMRRKYTIAKFIELTTYIRKLNPLFSISTDVIVGYPTETDDDFIISAKNIDKIKFATMHLFSYSPRKLTAAFLLKTVVPAQIIKQRFNKISEINAKNSLSYLKKFLKKTVTVLFEKSSIKDYQVGHTEYYFQVFVKTNKNLQNKMLQVKVTKILNNIAYGELV